MNNFFKLLGLLMFTFFTPLVFGEAMKFNGEFRVSGMGYLHSKPKTEELFSEVRFLPELEWNTNVDWRLYVQGDFRFDSKGYASGIFDGAEEDNRWIANARQAYAEYSQDLFTLTVGKQIFDWSVTDVISPSDNINPRDWIDVTQWERIGLPALQLHYGDMTFWEFVYLPQPSPSRLPRGRWAYDIPDDLLYAKPSAPNGSYDQFAARVGTNVNNWDLGLSWYHGHAYNPATNIRPPNIIAPNYVREDVVATSVVGEVGKGVMARGEIGYFRQHRNDDFIQLVAGLERAWNNVLRETDELNVTVQYADEITVKKVSDKSLRHFDMRRASSGTASLRLQYTLDDARRVAVQLEGGYNINKDSYAKASIKLRHKNVEFEAGVEIVSGGASNTLWGGWQHNDRAFVQCSVYV